uniref:Uncharacterized protein n=1 Tax=Timema tahoe TaxID=61484 RepID=A0A7R9P1F3_9NEOP|nr:unnamed protein product [Timema tahoe]
MSFDALENWLNSDYDEPLTIAEAPRPAAPNSLDQLTLFTEDGICLADGEWSMDFWDPYGLDEGLRDNIAPAVMHDVSGVLTPRPVIRIQHPVVMTPPPIRGQTPKDACGDLDAIDLMIFQLESENGGAVLSQPPAMTPVHPAAGAPPLSQGEGV